MKITDIQGRRIDLAESFLESGMFGDGSDGSPNLEGTATHGLLLRDVDQ